VSAPFSQAFLDQVRRLDHAGAWPRGTQGVVTGKAEDPEGERSVRIQLRIDPHARSLDARFQVFGCSATLACASYVTDAVLARDLATAASIDAASVARALDLPPERESAAELAVRALRDALQRASAAWEAPKLS